jgi:glucose-6-phosphate 1-epimerase
MNLEQLNREFALQGHNIDLQFKTGEGDIPVASILNELASASISLQGAHLLSWIPAGQEDVIWMSKDAIFTTGKSVRGGIPVCWPWFGAHETNTDFPAHGFARTVLWQVINTQQLASGETQITFELDTAKLDNKLRDYWPQATTVQYSLTIGQSLTLVLTTTNNSAKNITLGQALHTYFNVQDVALTRVLGLEGRDYLDKPDNFKRKNQTGPITIHREVDRIYLQTPDDVIIENPQRKIAIKKQGSRSTVVWNPWQQVAQRMGDLGEKGYLSMLCVESANAAQDTVIIEPGEQHKLWVQYQVESAPF